MFDVEVAVGGADCEAPHAGDGVSIAVWPVVVLGRDSEAAGNQRVELASYSRRRQASGL